MLTADVKKLFTSDDRGITLIITIGNSFRSDDGTGPYIFSRCEIRIPKSETSSKYTIINAEDKPENIIDEAIAYKPARTIIIDAADFGGKPGEARIIDQENIPNTTLSTHTFPIPIIAKMLEKDTGSKVVFLGIQPKKIEFGEGLSVDVKKTAEEIIACINK
ncbi:hydrogenase maturation peptidase HycI [Candidatus Saganbacteria bacterium]|nr:hydrogenase maturation peptidase HycI [Candidatus Saganbacteria bacterium]